MRISEPCGKKEKVPESMVLMVELQYFDNISWRDAYFLTKKIACTSCDISKHTPGVPKVVGGGLCRSNFERVFVDT